MISSTGRCRCIAAAGRARVAAGKEEPAPRPLPENRVAAGRNHFAEPAVAREPAAPRLSPAGNAPRPTGANYPNAQPGYHKQQGALYRKLLDTPSVEHKEHITVSPPLWMGIARVLVGY